MENTTRPAFYVVDAHTEARLQTVQLIQANGFPYMEFTCGEQFLSNSLPTGPACVILDLLDGCALGLKVQSRINLMNRPWPVLFHTASRCLPSAIQALKAGALDFLFKHEKSDHLAAILPAAAEEATTRYQRFVQQEAYRQRYESLTASERSVLQMLLQGLLNKQIAARLDLTVRTIEMRRATIVKKMGVSSVMELIGVAARFEQIVPPPSSDIPRHHFPTLPPEVFPGKTPPQIDATLEELLP
ncbi:MAG: LuxR C-terminal-related transcriptional regulator [Pirellulaceae bacterium]